ncbi:hypothetical protein JHK85_004294 [Glycine max]|nr:hypothetical protein JHK85_004294 [Glycine max]
MESGFGKLPIFEVEATIDIALDCMASLLKKVEANQASFCSASWAHPEELGMLVEVLKSGMVTSASGSQYRLSLDAKCDYGNIGGSWELIILLRRSMKLYPELDQSSQNLAVTKTTLLYHACNGSEQWIEIKGWSEE